MLDLSHLLRAFGSRTAILERGVETTYADLVKLVSTEEAWLEGVGIAAGDRVSLVCDHEGATVARALALLERGCAVMPLPVQLGQEEPRRSTRRDWASHRPTASPSSSPSPSPTDSIASC